MKKDVLIRSISFTTGFLTLVGTVIGAGIFFKPTAVFSATQDAFLGILAWVISGLIAFFGGMSIAELGAMFPTTGGIVVYLEKAYGKTIAYLTGWVQMALYFPGTLAALAIIFAKQCVDLLQIDKSFEIPLAALLLVFVVGINLLGNKYSGKIQVCFTLLKFLPLIIITVVGLFSPLSLQIFVSTDNSSVSLDSPLIRLGGGVLATVFAYDGWLNIGNLSGEIKNPSKNVPRVMLLGISLVTLMYILINMAYLFVASPIELANTSTPATFVAQRLFPNIGGKLITVGILISVFGGLNGYTMAAIRVPYTLAQRHWLPFSKQIGILHHKTKISIPSALIILVVALLLLLTGSFDSLTNLAVISIYFFTALGLVGVLILRKTQPALHRPYCVPCYPIVPIIAIVGSLFIIVSSAIVDPLTFFYSICLTLVGLPFYWWVKIGIKLPSNVTEKINR